MEIKKTLAAAAVALTLAAPATFAFQDSTGTPSQQREHSLRRGHGFGRKMMDRAAAELNLTDQQKAFAKQLWADSRTQAKPIRTELRQVRTDLNTAIQANNASQIEQLTQRQGVLSGQLAALHAKARASFYAQLTPEQQTKANQMRENARERFKQRASRFQNNQQ